MPRSKSKAASRPAAAPAAPPPQLEASELLAGFHAVLHRTGVTASAMLDGSSLAYALAEVLVAKGLLGLDELDKARKGVEARMSTDLAVRGVPVRLTDGVTDKYELGNAGVEIDCAARLHLCHAACCRLRFALSEQDVEEGIVQWSVREPYLNRQTPDGYCAHIKTDRFCGVYENRPSVCRSYDCRGDKRIWVDFEARIPNPQLLAATGPAPEPPAPPDGEAPSP